MLLLLTFGLMTVSCIDETFVGEGGNKHAEDRGRLEEQWDFRLNQNLY